MKIHVTMAIDHDATDPSANDTTMDVSELILTALKTMFDVTDIVDRSQDRIVISATADLADPAKYHVED